MQRRIRRVRFPVVKAIDTFGWTCPSRIDRNPLLSLFDFDFAEKRKNALFIGGT